ncbi:MAG: helix-turn-helix domain-containing protein [Xanthomonadales bacterium]|nr:helix-turn-helix domain-containing protein [Xanthomonadales bacterium]
MDVQTRRETRPELLTVKEYADWYRVDVRTVYRWVADGAVPTRRVGPRRGLRIISTDDETDND